MFTPAVGAPNSTTTTVFQLSDASSAQPNGTPAMDSHSQVTDTDSPTAPTITNTSTAADLDGRVRHDPIRGRHGGRPQRGHGHQRWRHGDRHADHHAAGRDGHAERRGGLPERHADTGGTAPHTYTLTGTGAAITAELDQLVFTPDPTGNPNGSVTTVFQLSDVSQVGGASNTDSTSEVTDTDSAVAPTINNISTPADLDRRIRRDPVRRRYRDGHQRGIGHQHSVERHATR